MSSITRRNSFTILSMAMVFAAAARNVQSVAEHGRRRSDEKGRAEANFYSSKKLNRRVQDGPIKSQSRRAVRLPVERLVIIAIAIRLLNEFGKRIRRDQLFAAAHVKYAS